MHALIKSCLVSLITLPWAAIAADGVFIELPFRYVLGGYAQGQWQNSAQAGPALREGTKFRLFTLKGESGKLITSKAAPELDVCPEVWLAKVRWKGQRRAIGLSASWNPLPRAVQAAPANDAAVAKAAMAVLAGHHIQPQAVDITQHLRADLDGDGADEVLFTAMRFATAEKPGGVPMEIKAGDYCFIALGRLAGGQLTTQLLEADFFPNAVTDAPIVREIGAVLDLNGDGGLEIVLHGTYYEGGGTSVWRFEKGAAKRVLQLDCGL